MTDLQRQRMEALIARAGAVRVARDGLRVQLEEARARWQALRDATYWAELDSGESIAVGDTVRYLGREYRCVKEHTKAVLRGPLNGMYWAVVEEAE